MWYEKQCIGANSFFVFVILNNVIYGNGHKMVILWKIEKNHETDTESQNYNNSSAMKIKKNRSRYEKSVTI